MRSILLAKISVWMKDAKLGSFQYAECACGAQVVLVRWRFARGEKGSVTHIKHVYSSVRESWIGFISPNSSKWRRSKNCELTEVFANVPLSRQIVIECPVRIQCQEPIRVEKNRCIKINVGQRSENEGKLTKMRLAYLRSALVPSSARWSFPLSNISNPSPVPLLLRLPGPLIPIPIPVSMPLSAVGGSGLSRAAALFPFKILDCRFIFFLGLEEEEEGDDENEKDCTNRPKPDRRGARTAAVTFGIAVGCISLARLGIVTRGNK